jgi:hypothetical protein
MKATTALLLLILMTATAAAQDIGAATASADALQENVEASAIAGEGGSGGWDLEETKKGAVPRSASTEEDGMVPGRVYVRSNPDRGIVHLEVFDASGELVRSATYSDDGVFSDENEFRALAAQLDDASDPLVFAKMKHDGLPENSSHTIQNAR